MAIDRIGVQPIIAAAGNAVARQTYKVGDVGESEVVSGEVSCTNDLSVAGNRNLVHWQGEGTSFRVYKSEGGPFGLIGTSDGDAFLDDNIAPDTAQQPPVA